MRMSMQGLFWLTLIVSFQFSSAAEVKPTDYEAARWDPLHFKPAIDNATNEQCLNCHQEVIERRTLSASPAGLKASDTLAWYQTLGTYKGEQETFHRRHLVTPLATELMQLKCNTCHQGNDPREETAGSSATGSMTLTQRRHVDPETCLMCHGQFNYKVMTGLTGSWTQVRDAFANNCVSCHVAFRTNRHKVNFLKPAAIEESGKADGDVCYGCHGGRSWYRIGYDYPRHPWPGMPEEIPEWAKDRPTESQSRFLIDLD